MDGAAEAHNISFGCRRSAINIGPISEDMMGVGGGDINFWSRCLRKSGGVGCRYPFFSPLLHQTRPRLLHPRNASLSCF